MEEPTPLAPTGPSTGPNKAFKGRYNILNDPNTAPARIYVGNLSEQVKEADLKARFDVYGQVTDILLKKGFAFIQFMSKDSAAEAIARENKTQLYDKIIAVRTAVKKANENEGGSQESNPMSTMLANIANNVPLAPKMPKMNPRPSPQQMPGRSVAQFNHTTASNHIEIMAMDRNYTQYAENIERYLKDRNLKVDILYPNNNVPMPDLLENIQRRGTLFALEVDDHNVQDQTVTVYILYADKIKWQRDMRVQDALEHVQKFSEEYVQPSNSIEPFSNKDNGDEPSQFTTFNDNTVKNIEQQLATLVKTSKLTVTDLDGFIDRVRQMRRALAVLENPSNPEPEPEEPEPDPLEERIKGIVSSENYLEKLSKPEPFVMTKERLALLHDPKVERALDTLLHPDIFSTLDLSFIKNM